jgi:hypothetical protein
MNENETYCPECLEPVERRDFLRTVGVGAAALTVGGVLAPAASAMHRAPVRITPRPAESLCHELFGTLTADQKQRLVLPWNSPNRLRTYNAAMNVRIGDGYTAPQRELLQRIMRAISSGDDGYNKLARGGTWDTGGGFNGCGANFFGDVSEGHQWAWVFSGHHLTVRCDGNSQPNAAFGGPMYYGHSPDGNSVRNVFNFQTRAVQSVYDALSDAQRRRATMATSSGNQNQPRRANFPGIPATELTADQRRLVETVMRELLTPYRREDVDEVMDIVRRNGGLDRLHFGFYRDGQAAPGQWTYWRIEGPGFVWNYRILPHVHCWVNIAAQA